MVLPVSYLPHPQPDLQAEADEDQHPGPSPFTGPCGWSEPLVLKREEQEEGQGWSRRVLTWALLLSRVMFPGASFHAVEPMAFCEGTQLPQVA